MAAVYDDILRRFSAFADIQPNNISALKYRNYAYILPL